MEDQIRIKIARLSDASKVDGPGVRTVLWVQGCRRGCPGCQNLALQDGSGGWLVDAFTLGQLLVAVNASGDAAGSHLYTITGGEPMDQPLALATVAAGIRKEDPEAHIIVYTGYKWEELAPSGGALSIESSPAEMLFRLAMSRIDVLVDGPYIQNLDSAMMQYVGSSNQRVIDVQASLFDDELSLLDWASEGLFTIESGNMTMAGGWLAYAGLDGIGNETRAPNCGQAERGEDHG